jgi:hypothetical protein
MSMGVQLDGVAIKQVHGDRTIPLVSQAVNAF